MKKKDAETPTPKSHRTARLVAFGVVLFDDEWRPRQLFGIKAHAAGEVSAPGVSARRTTISGVILGQEGDCVAHFVTRCKAIRADATFIRSEGLHYSLRIIQTITQITNIVPSIPYPNIVAPYLLMSSKLDFFILYPDPAQTRHASQPSYRPPFGFSRVSLLRGLQVVSPDLS
jgi:hypothetical protein